MVEIQQANVRRVKVGTCGFGMAKDAYARLFSCVEIQNTFYQPPQLKTLERWRSEVPTHFEFTLKAWQLITHTSRSPTYRRLKRTLSNEEMEETGSFRPSQIVEEAWKQTVASAEALNAKTIVFQCPASFTPTQENVHNMDMFFTSMDRHDMNLCWEPRGNWQPDLVKAICSKLELCHVVDPFVRKSVTPDRCYFRLHGRTGWRYQYEPYELGELADLILRKSGYVFFNNSSMTEDALRFCDLPI